MLSALGAYVALSVLLFGLPVIAHPGSRIIGLDQIDSSSYMWLLAWWPHALLHGLNPFVTHAQFYPDGFNLAWTAPMPLEATILAPITLGIGPIASWNILQLASPALSAWTAFLLCHHVTGRVWPSGFGGYIFGFSPYMLAELTGAPNLAMVALVPVLVLVVLRRLDEVIGPRRFVLEMALTLTAQYLTSTDVLASSTLFGGFAFLLAFVLCTERRAALLKLAKLLVLSYAAMAVLVSPFLYFFFFGQRLPPTRNFFTADLAGFVLPPGLVAITPRHRPTFLGSNEETYLGLPLILLIALFGWQYRRNRTAWIIVLSLLSAAIVSLGGFLTVRGNITAIRLPWYWIGRLPVLRYATTVRFGLFVILPAALIVAIWLSREPARSRRGIPSWGLTFLAVAFIFPDVGNPYWNTHVKDPPFFARDTYRSYLMPGDHVLTVPAFGPNERWLADAGIPFAITAGYLGTQDPVGYARFATWRTLVMGTLTPDYAAQLRRFVAAKRVTAVVVDQTAAGPWRALFSSLGVQPTAIGGMLLYRLRPTPSSTSTRSSVHQLASRCERALPTRQC